ncbi:MAG TPA: glycosyltransferase family 39 protein [Solirubrobacteraceae bacterium]|nr:glycosyltransferase family 39 protein [Solirubrobacteraceae bacterium]
MTSSASANVRSIQHFKLDRRVWLIALAEVCLLVVTSTRYGYHRDELYFVVAGGHPAIGYPDQPPLVPLLCWAMNWIAPGSLLMLRAPSALVAGATTVLAALVTREVGGRSDAQIIAALCTAVSGFGLAVAHLVSTTTFDMLSTTALGLLVIRAVARNQASAILYAGLVVGVGVLAKPQVGLVALVMTGSLLALGPRAMLRTRWALGGACVAIALSAPYVIWQAQHGWPQATVASNIAGSQEGGRAGFFPFQLVMVSPVLVAVWVAGLAAPFRMSQWRALRFVPVSYLALAVLYFIGDGHAYYLASLYPVLLGLGAPVVAQWCRARRWRVALLASAIAVSGAFSILIALPVLPERDLQGSAVIALNSAQGETVGWPRFIDAVSAGWRSLGRAERGHTAIFTLNYGEAGAIDLLGAAHGLPQAFSGHNGFSEWGPPPDADRYALVEGLEAPSELTNYFTACRTVAVVENDVGLDNDEQGLPVRVCRTERPWSRMWSGLRHYD